MTQMAAPYRNDFFYDWANARSEQGDFKGAIEEYNQAIRIDPTDDTNYNNRGVARSRLGHKLEAIKDYTQAIQINPNNHVAYFNRGEDHAHLGNYQEAIEDFTQEIRIAGDHPLSYESRGVARSHLGNKLGAIEDLRKAASLYQEGGWSDYYQQVLKLIQALEAAYEDTVGKESQEILETANNSPTLLETIEQQSVNQSIADSAIEATTKDTSQEIRENINQSITEEIEDIAAAQEHLNAEGYFNPKTIKKAKELITISIARRQGQSQFRQSLLEAYNYRCAITGFDVQEALEAAHIIPYSDTENNHPSNGLLLRADLHTLFDLNLIAINPDTMQVYLTPNLRHTSYGELHGKPLQLPKNKAYYPRKDALEWRCNQCREYR
jgi:tetratricopeptide (TPR) repeat protein